MTHGESFIESLPKKLRFYDRNERRSYELTRAVAARLVDDPRLVKIGLDFVRRHMSGDARQSQYLVMWEELLRHDVRDIARQLLDDTPRGELLRDTQPVFCVLPSNVRQEIVARARAGAVAA